MTFCRLRALAAAMALGCAVSGCASVAEGNTQPITVATAPIAGATCTLSNTRGKWSVVTPGTVIVEKSNSVIKAVCVKDGWQDGAGYLTPHVPAMAMVGMMMPYVGLVSAAVDGSTGAGSVYPSSLLVSLKEMPPPATAPQPGVSAQTVLQK